MRTAVMESLARRLAGPASRLVFNVHANAWSTQALTSLYRRLHGWPPPTTLSYRTVRKLVQSAGLEIEALYGYGLLPRRLHASPLRGAMESIDRRVSGGGLLGRVCQDMVFVCKPAMGVSAVASSSC